MAWVAAAVVGGALIGAYSSNKAAGAQADASNNATQAQTEASNNSLALQKQINDQQVKLNQPWQDAGLKALKSYAGNPGFKFSAADFTADPSYKYQQEQGVNALDMSAASRGKLLSGAQDKAVTQFGQNLANTNYNNAYNQALQNYNTNQNTQLNVANLGRGAAGQTQSALQNYGNNASNTMTNLGNAQAQNYTNLGNAQANAYTGMAQSTNQAIGNGLYMYNLQNKTPTVAV